MLLSFFPSLVARTQFTRCTEWVVSTQLITFRWRRQKRWDQMIATRADTHCQWVWVTISGLIAKTKKAVIAALMSSGIQAEFDQCCFHYFGRNSLVALLEALCARERWWNEAQFSIHRRQSEKIEQKKFITRANDDDCFYYHSWRNNVVIAFGTLSSFLT